MTKSRIFWMVLTALGLAAILWGIVTLRNSSNDPAVAGSPAAQGVQDRYLPVIFTDAASEGQALSVSGTSTPESFVKLRKGDVIISEVQADSNGLWQGRISLADIGVGQSGFSLEAVAALPDGMQVRSSETLFIVSGPAATDIDMFDTLPLPDPAILLVQPGGPTQVMQSPFGSLPQSDGLTLEAADYDNAGGIIFTGTSVQEGRIRVYANSALIGETGTGEGGRWTLIAGSTLPVGAYTVKIALFAPSGDELADMIVPFERVAPETINAALSDIGRLSGAIFKDDVWQLSRSLYGGGFQHTVIYSPLVLIP